MVQKRIFEAYKNISKNKKFDLIIDVQGDEPLVSPISYR
jgi:CMP-2-keto-3-deoxyoctulosonic acid synthetase